MINSLLTVTLIFISGLKSQGETSSHLFPPGALGSNSMSEYNVTGPLNSFVEQIQANSRSQEVPPIVQMPQAVQGRGSVIYYGENPQQPQPMPPMQQYPQPVIIGPQNRPTLDPALQQLLNSFNTNQMDQRVSFATPQQNHPMAAELNTPVVSYITCYVGCSHVTNIITNSASVLKPSFNVLSTSILLLASIFVALLI